LLSLLSAEEVAGAQWASIFLPVAPATFFATGMITRNPETFRREAGNSAEDRDDREGHPVANHSLTQVDVGNTSNWGARRELTITDHFIRDVTGKEVEHFLLYGGNETQSTQDLVEGLKRSQRDCDFGASCDFDSNDWRYAAHELKGRDAAPPTERAELPAPLHEAGGTDGEGKKAIEEVGGSIDVTFVQDWDLSLFLHRAAWRVTCDDEATAYREIFENADALHQQRTRSTFGSLQAVWKHHHLRVRWVTNCWARACCRNMPLPSSFPSSSSLVVVHGHPDSSRGGH